MCQNRLGRGGMLYRSCLELCTENNCFFGIVYCWDGCEYEGGIRVNKNGLTVIIENPEFRVGLDYSRVNYVGFKNGKI